jgi:ribosomal protein L21E
VIDKRGRGYIVRVAQGNSMREIIVRTEHLEPYKGA